MQDFREWPNQFRRIKAKAKGIIQLQSLLVVASMVVIAGSLGPIREFARVAATIGCRASIPTTTAKSLAAAADVVLIASFN